MARCNHDEVAINDDEVCECGFGPMARRVDALMRLLVRDGHATQNARYQMDALLREETRRDPRLAQRFMEVVEPDEWDEPSN